MTEEAKQIIIQEVRGLLLQHRVNQELKKKTDGERFYAEDKK